MGTSVRRTHLIHVEHRSLEAALAALEVRAEEEVDISRRAPARLLRRQRLRLGRRGFLLLLLLLLLRVLSRPAVRLELKGVSRGGVERRQLEFKGVDGGD
jgi:hypothetical protein